MAYALLIPLASASGEDWINEASSELKDAYQGPLKPEYGGEANITKPKK